jgi:hypothetical protein
MYLLWQAQASVPREARRVRHFPWWGCKRCANELRCARSSRSFAAGRMIYNAPVQPDGRGLGGMAHPLTDHRRAGALAAALLQPLRARRRGHLEVGKNIYYTVTRRRTWCSA